MSKQNQNALANGLAIKELVRSNQGSEAGYRRGVSQALWLAADLVQDGCSQDDLNWLCDESLLMRCDRTSHPAYLDELRKRYHKHRERVRRLGE